MGANHGVLIRGVGSHNGGAELLLYAAAERLRVQGYSPVVDMRRINRDLRAKWNLGGAVSVIKFGLAESLGVDLLPRAVSAKIGISSQRDLAGVLDASGFAYGDGWDAAYTRTVASAYRRYKRAGRKVVLLPQAFGPFEDPDMRRASEEIAEVADLIFARDQESYANMVGLVGKDDRLALAPDITIGLQVAKSDHDNLRRVAIVPNINIVAKAGTGGREKYVSSLVQMHRLLEDVGFSPFFLVHSKHGDPAIAAECRLQLPNATVETPSNGVEAKILIAGCAGIIAGRYHALVSALSQAVPVVAHSWSHKYGELLEEFGCPDAMGEPLEAESSVQLLVAQISSDSRQVQLRSSAQSRLAEVDLAWSRVFEILGEMPRLP